MYASYNAVFRLFTAKPRPDPFRMSIPPCDAKKAVRWGGDVGDGDSLHVSGKGIEEFWRFKEYGRIVGSDE